MSLKLLKLHWKVFFWTATGKIKKINSNLQLTQNREEIRTIFIIFPLDEPSFRVAYYTFRDLGKKSTMKTNYIFLVRKEFKNLFHLNFGECLFISNCAPLNVLLEERNLLNRLKTKKIDIIIDLNPKLHLGTSRFVSLLDSKLKVGFESKFSDKFYNIQLDISKSGIMEKGFKQINWMLA